MTLVPYNAEDSCLKNPSGSLPEEPKDAFSGSQASSASLDIDLAEKQEDDAVAVPVPSYGGTDASSTHSTRGVDRPQNHDAAVDAPGGLTTCISPGAPSIAGTATSGATVLTFPEGGLSAWLVVLGSFSAMLSVFGIINTAAVFESWFSTHQLAAYDASQIGWVFSLYLFVVFFIGIQVGPVFDHYGPRLLVAAGSALLVASLLLLGLCTEYYQILLAYSVLGGLGGAMLNTPAYGGIAHFFEARRGFATGIATTAGGIGGIVFPILLQKLLPTLGFAWSTRILGLILLALAVPANLFIRTRLPVKAHTGSVWPDLTLFRSKPYALAALGVFFMEWGLFIPLTFMVSYAAAYGQDPNSAYTLLSLLNAGSVAGRLLPGLLADRFGRFNVIILTISLCIATVLGLWLPADGSHAMLIAFAVVFGFASGSNLGLAPVCLGQLCEARDFGRFLSTALMLASFGTLSSVPIGGALLGINDGNGGWTALVAFSGASYMMALVCYTAARVLAVGWDPKTIF